MKETFITGYDNMLWLFEVHLQPFNEEFYERVKFGGAIIYGNEDAPEFVAIFEQPNPHYRVAPLQCFIQSELSGNLVKLEGRFERKYMDGTATSVQELIFSDALHLCGSMRALLNLIAMPGGTLPIPKQPGHYVRFVAS